MRQALKQGLSTGLTRLAGRAEPCRGAFSELRSFRRGKEGAAPRSRASLVKFSEAFFSLFLLILGTVLVPFGSYFGPRGVPGDPLGSLCAIPLPQDPPKPDFELILGAFWDPFWSLVGTSFRLRARCGPSRRPFLSVFGSVWSPLGFDIFLGR